MTLKQLINKARHISCKLTSGDIPIYYNGKEVEISLFLVETDDNNYRIKLVI